MKRFEIGEKVTLPCVAVQGDTVFLDMNAKAEGVLDASEVCDANGKCSLKAGDKVTVYYIGNVNGEDKFTTRLRAAANGGRRPDETMLENAFNKGIPVEGKVDKEIKGGYEVLLGAMRAFCPYSQAGINAREGGEIAGRTLTFLITEMKDGGGTIVVSRRAVEEEEKTAAASALSSKLHAGDNVTGKITSLRGYGAFVDIGGFEALLPISEIAREKVDDVSKYLAVGQEVKAKVINCDWARGRVSVSMKSLLRDPWDGALDKYGKGTKHEGVVQKTAPYGVFIELESGLEGLMHISTIEGLERNTNIAKIYKKGQRVSVKVLDIDTQERRISLAPTTSAEIDRAAEQYMAKEDSADTYNPFAMLCKK